MLQRLISNLYSVISDLYSTVNILKFTMHLCIYGSLYSTVLSTVQSTQALLMCINTFKYKGWLYIAITDLSDMAFVKIDHHNNQIPYFPIDILQDVENFITDNVKMTPTQVGA